jgi:hypothetical protein
MTTLATRSAKIVIVMLCPLGSLGWAAPLPDEAIPKTRQVLVISPGNQVLDAFFKAVAESKELGSIKHLKPANLKDEDKYLRPARAGLYQVVIFDRCGPATKEQMPRGNTVFIGYLPPPWKPSEINQADNPRVASWMKKHPLLEHVTDLEQIGIGKAFTVKDLPDKAERLVEGKDKTVLLFTLTRDRHTDLVLTFPLIDSKDEWNTNWPLKPSFPLFLHNVLLTLGKVEDKQPAK